MDQLLTIYLGQFGLKLGRYTTIALDTWKSKMVMESSPHGDFSSLCKSELLKGFIFPFMTSIEKMARKVVWDFEHRNPM